MGERRRMKRDTNARTSNEYTELCKTIRKKRRKHTRQKSIKMVENTVANSRSLQEAIQNLRLGKSNQCHQYK